MKHELDSLGRFVIPVKYRRKLEIKSGDELDIRIHKNTLIIKKAYPTCAFCENEEHLICYEGKMLCCDCIQKISNIALQKIIF